MTDTKNQEFCEAGGHWTFAPVTTNEWDDEGTVLRQETCEDCFGEES